MFIEKTLSLFDKEQKYILKTHILNIKYPKISNVVVSVGSFDGLHKGHRFVLETLRKEAKSLKAESLVLTFEPHPRIVLNKNNTQIQLLTSLEEKQLLLEEIGIDHLLVYPFTKEFSQMNPEDFIIKILYKKIGMRKLIIGFDHFFGNNRTGSIELIKNLSQKHQFQYKVIESVNDNHKKISSTKIRNALQEGNLNFANDCLGYSYILRGKVIKGYQIGRKIGFPTANLKIKNKYKLLPPPGVYVVKVYLRGVWMGAMMNFGINPTFDNSRHKKMEIHIFSLKEKLYGECLTIGLMKKIRNEIRFDNVKDLRKQLEQDETESIRVLKELNIKT